VFAFILVSLNFYILQARAGEVSLSASCRSNSDLGDESCRDEQNPIQAAAKKIWGPDIVSAHPALVDFRVCKDFESCFAKDCSKSPTDNGDGSGFKDASRPFVMFSQSQPAKGSVVLTHGLTDSPYSMGQIAENLRKNGYNVVSILLSNHGADHKDCDQSEESRWPGDIEHGVALARQLFGENGNLCLGGYSTGGALTVDYEQTHPNSKIACNLLFDPALALPNPVKTAAEVLIGEALIKKGFRKLSVVTDKNGEVENSANPARTPFCDSDGIAIYDTIKRIKKASTLETQNKRLEIPTFSIFSSGKSGVMTDPNALTVDSPSSRRELFGNGAPSTGIFSVGDAVVHNDINHLDVTIGKGRNLDRCRVTERAQNGNPYLDDDLQKMDNDLKAWVEQTPASLQSSQAPVGSFKSEK
jgi:pimeloyl-ACP methyl ester carboxylesterase